MYIIKSLIMELYEMSMPDRTRFGLQKTKTILEMKDWVKYEETYVSKRTAAALNAHANWKKNKQKSRQGRIKDYNIYFVICNIIYSNVENMVKKEIYSIYNKRHYNNGGKERQALFYKSYFKKHTEYAKKYSRTEKGKIARSKVMAKRKRNLNWIQLFDNPFPEEIEVHYHHYNDFFVIPIPNITHIATYGMNHRERCNLWIKKLFGLDLRCDLIESDRLRCDMIRFDKI